ncbi:hypothetical protein DRJ48_04650 [Candidatus Woesearchaeota archaeon]|nr:MAG: hypothetical protein DRJ48_04650 [Candidatus Woesearchaeota archaeon]
MPDNVEFVKLTGMTPFQVCRSRYSKLVEGYLISKAYELGVLVPSMPTHDDVRERRQSSYKGAFVYEPKPGLYENIAVFDFRSLYPTIIVAHNISPETLKCECCKTATVPGRNDLWFCTKVKGFIPTVIRELITRRMRLKRIMKEQKQGVEVLRARDYALKTLANSMYGYLGFFASRWYSFESALSITAYGRFYLNMVIERAKKHGFNVIYGDTDSIFLELGEHKLEEALEFVNGINSELPEMMELKFEGFYPRGIFVSMKDTSMGAKKKYALVNKEGEITVRGFETVRRNWSLLAREAQMRVLEIVLKDKDIERAVEYIKELIKRVKSNQVSKEMMVIKTQIQKPISEYESIAPHVAVAKKLIERGQKVEIGDIIEYVIINGSGRIGDRAEPAEFVEEPDYDAEYYVKNQILPAVDTIFRELGVDIAEEVASKDQSKLNKFF